MNKFLLVLFLTISVNCYALVPDEDPQELSVRIEQLEQKVEQLSSDARRNSDNVANLRNGIASLNIKLNALEAKSDSIDNNILSQVNSNLNLSNSKHEEATKMIHGVETESKSNLHRLSNWGIIAAVTLLIIACIIYIILRRGISKSSDAISAIRKAQDNLQEESIKLYTKLVELLDKQMNVEHMESSSSSNIDHSLALKVADEITRIEMNLTRMDSSVRGYKQLSKAVERIKNNFQANGYDIVTYVGQSYNEGMRINADFVIDEDLPEGTRIITSVSKPQVHYKGELIQKATVSVTQNI